MACTAPGAGDLLGAGPPGQGVHPQHHEEKATGRHKDGDVPSRSQSPRTKAPVQALVAGGGRCGLDVGGQEGEGSLEESAPEWGLQGWVEVGEAEPCRVGREGGYLGQREWMM